MYWCVAVMYAIDLDLTSHWKVAAAADWNLGTVGSRRPVSIPDTTLTFPFGSVDVRVDRSVESLKLADHAKSRLRFGTSSTSVSNPWLRAFGTLKISREEHDPAVTVACKSLMSIRKTARLNDTL